jgi:hypothetical protein
VTACERCDNHVPRRTRCAICKRLCCAECLDWPRMRDGIRWCRRTRDVKHTRIAKLCQTGCDKDVKGL